ncbi:MAG: GSCFA domain-containing protein [Bacteroidales bacterium]|jgi:hypothetical protein|nr:GSCFA domain-containing protein [Bacteroidales bacterium]
MQFRTQIPALNSDIEINHHDKIMMLGSCFTENMGKALKKLKFDIDLNPFGITYNPYSIAQHLEILANGILFSENDLRQYNNLWHSFQHHSSFSSISKEESLQNINFRLEKSFDFLKNSKFLFITFGSSHYYTLCETNEIVSNCHKYPSKNFKKQIADIEDITKVYNDIFKKILSINPELKIILTISPVRYLSDGFHENQVSKSILQILCYNLENKFEQLSYFPSYEIMIDDLRDYRFYENDFIHPNNLAIDYIFEHFKKGYFKKETLDLISKIEEINRAMQHRAFFPDNEKFRVFKSKILENVEQLKKQHPHLNMDAELKYFSE